MQPVNFNPQPPLEAQFSLEMVVTDLAVNLTLAWLLFVDTLLSQATQLSCKKGLLDGSLMVFLDCRQNAFARGTIVKAVLLRHLLHPPGSIALKVLECLEGN